MNDIERVRGWFDSGALLRPATAVPNSVDLARALAHLAGAPDIERGPGVKRIIDAIGPSEHYAFILIDGLGLRFLEATPEAAFMREHAALELQSVFPAATAAALTSLATGLWPAQHGVPAWWTHLPEHDLTATMLPFVERFSQRPLGALGVTTGDAFAAPSLPARYRYTVRSFLPRSIVDSVYSKYARGGTPATGYSSFAKSIRAMARHITTAAPPSFTYLYSPMVDTVAHRDGPDAPSVRAAVREVDRELERLAGAVQGRARIVVSADHGFVAVPESAKHIVQPGDALLELLAVPPSGEPRVPFFHVRSGHGERFREHFRARYGERLALLSIDEAEELAFFGPGPLRAVTRRRIGDFLALSPEPDVLVYQAEGGADARAPLGHHGGLRPDEARIPLIVA